MSWFKRLWPSRGESSLPEQLRGVSLAIPGWSEEAPSAGMRVWRNPQGDLLTLATTLGVDLPTLSDETDLQSWCRSIAESRAAGLIDVRVTTGALGATARLIYKRLERPAYIFTGMLFVPSQAHVWTVVAGERGTTGVREAVVTAELMNAGKLTIQSYESSWARDPYDPSYRGVDRSVLRFISDDECYDELFPEHPLSKIRRVLALLPASVGVESLESIAPNPARLILLLDESCLLVYPSADAAARDIEAIDMENEFRAAFDETGVPYRVEWIRPNERGRLSVTNGAYHLVPAGPRDSASLLALVRAYPTARTTSGESVDVVELTRRAQAG